MFPTVLSLKQAIHFHPARCKPCSTVWGAQLCCCCLCWMRSSKPNSSCDPPGSQHCGLLWILGAQQVGKSPSPALSLLLQSLSNDVFSCLLVTYRDTGQSWLLWRLPGGTLLPAPHARKAVAALPKASLPSAPGDRREPHAHLVSGGKGKECGYVSTSLGCSKASQLQHPKAAGEGAVTPGSIIKQLQLCCK